MADTKYHSPFLGSITATTTAQSLFTLLSAYFTNLPAKACHVIIQLDLGSGGTTLTVGNSGMTSTNYGSVLAASQADSTLFTPRVTRPIRQTLSVEVSTLARSGFLRRSLSQNRGPAESPGMTVNS